MPQCLGEIRNENELQKLMQLYMPCSKRYLKQNDYHNKSKSISVLLILCRQKKGSNIFFHQLKDVKNQDSKHQFNFERR